MINWPLLRHVLEQLQRPHLDVVAGGLGRAVHQFAGLERVGHALLGLAGGDLLLLDLHQAGDRDRAGALVAEALLDLGAQSFQYGRESFLGDERVQIVAVCDVNRESAGYWDGKIGGREPARRLVESHYAAQKSAGTFQGCKAYHDFREVLGRKDIDAVEVATPDHWHAIPVIAACKAGKDIYCQKPLSLTIAEGRAMCNAVKRYQRVFQTGSQQRSDVYFRRACEFVRNGRIGKLHTVKCGLPGGRPDYARTGGHKKPEKTPDGFDYNFWLGPAPMRRTPRLDAM